jgi:hypothetical protein
LLYSTNVKSTEEAKTASTAALASASTSAVTATEQTIKRNYVGYTVPPS